MDEFKAQAPVVKDDWRSATMLAPLEVQKMLAPLEVQKMLALKALGWGSKRISREMGCCRNMVREYLRRGEWRPMDVSSRGGTLEPYREWLAERLRQHRGNADVVRQDLLRELGVAVSTACAKPSASLRTGMRWAEQGRPAHCIAVRCRASGSVLGLHAAVRVEALDRRRLSLRGQPGDWAI